MSDAIGDARPSTDPRKIAHQGKNRLNRDPGLAPKIVMDHILARRAAAPVRADMSTEVSGGRVAHRATTYRDVRRS
ncbi:hypothetical protein [Rhodoplanes elegans]|uniref:hypothetical protein n=1 Tax=Rhodoplanes elegans TaxID=29408 RepID=UPI0011B94B11|nr:hypothetical protein [Rhodoplanes elegans]